MINHLEIYKIITCSNKVKNEVTPAKCGGESLLQQWQDIARVLQLQPHAWKMMKSQRMQIDADSSFVGGELIDHVFYLE